MKSRVQDTYPLEDVMALAVMAQRINGEYLTNPTREFDDEGVVIKINHSNKDLIRFGTGTSMYKTSTFVDSDGNKFADYSMTNVADEEDLEVAQEIISYYTGLMFKAIGGKINQFEERVLEIVKTGEVSSYDFGVIASLPKSYARNVEREAVEEKQRELSDNSQFIGQVGKTIDLDLDIMRFNFIQKLNCYVVNGVDADGNLVVFFTSNEDFNGPTSLKVRGRVKRHQNSNYHGGKETVFNYVKAI
jgi:hypothetical protein